MPGLKAGPAATFEDVHVRPLDLTNDNNPELVFSAQMPAGKPVAVAPRSRATRNPTPPPAVPANFYFYVTVVARLEPSGEFRKLFSSVTDSGHLDSFPRLELVDAVDSSGNGRGDLLFRAVNDRGRTYQLYRVTRDGLYKLFEGGSPAP